ncbi:DUF4397 domain-containing protein [Mesobacillus maritimus]|uniref:DUF4397 domain-containing protein n=1 Tax=Mesobacillus maritimus TaxID=1643336 RepID=UPI00384D2932
MTVNESAANYLYKAAMYQELSNFYKYGNLSPHIYGYLNHIKNHNKPSQRTPTTYRSDSQPLPARLRVFHSDKSNRKLDIYLDGIPIITDLSYSETNQYLLIPPGKHQIIINVAGNRGQQLLKKNIFLAAGRYYTLVTTKDSRNQKLLAFEDHPIVPVGEAKIRFLNLSPNAREIDIAVKNRDVIFPKLNYRNATSYLGITPMKLDLEARKHGTNEVVLNLPILSLKPNTAYSGIILENDDFILWSDIQHPKDFQFI